MGQAATRYYASISRKGPLLQRDVPGSIGVLEAPDEFIPIGQADPAGPDEDGIALWRLNVHKRPVPGFWRLFDGEFRPAR